MLTLNYQEHNVTTARLHLNAHSIQKISRLTPHVVSLVGYFEPSRLKVEQFIQHK